MADDENSRSSIESGGNSSAGSEAPWRVARRSLWGTQGRHRPLPPANEPRQRKCRRAQQSRDMTGPSTAGRSASMPPNASAACAASKPASGKQCCPGRASLPHLGRRYVTLEGEETARIDSQADPREHRGVRFGRRISLRRPLQGREGREGFLRAEAVQSLHESCLRTGLSDRRNLQDRGWRRSHRPYLLHRVPILRASLSLRRPLLQRGEECYRQMYVVLPPHHQGPTARHVSRFVRSVLASSEIATTNKVSSASSSTTIGSRYSGPQPAMLRMCSISA